MLELPIAIFVTIIAILPRNALLYRHTCNLYFWSQMAERALVQAVLCIATYGYAKSFMTSNIFDYCTCLENLTVL